MKKGSYRPLQRPVRAISPEIALTGFAAPAIGSEGRSGIWGGFGSIMEKLGGLQDVIKTMTQLRKLADSFRPFAPFLQTLWGKLNARTIVPAGENATNRELLPPHPGTGKPRKRRSSRPAKASRPKRRPRNAPYRSGKKQRPRLTDWDPLLIAYRT